MDIDGTPGIGESACAAQAGDGAVQGADGAQAGGSD